MVDVKNHHFHSHIGFCVTVIHVLLVWHQIGDVANSKRSLLMTPKVQLRLRILPPEVGKSFLRVKI